MNLPIGLLDFILRGRRANVELVIELCLLDHVCWFLVVMSMDCCGENVAESRGRALFAVSPDLSGCGEVRAGSVGVELESGASGKTV